MPGEIIQFPTENDPMDEIYQVLAQIGEVVENEQTEKGKFIICPNCGQKISDMNSS